LDLQGANQQIASLADVAGATVFGVVKNSDTTTPAVLTLNETNGATLYSGSIDGNLSLVKQGAGTQVLAGALTYTGNTDIQAGMLQVATQGEVTLSTVTGAGTLSVCDGTSLKATSIVIDTLSIGGSPVLPGPVVVVPEPSTFVLSILGFLGLAGWAWRKK
jgi:fibronectin-binding autotransporter adhesin